MNERMEFYQILVRYGKIINDINNSLSNYRFTTFVYGNKIYQTVMHNGEVTEIYQKIF